MSTRTLPLSGRHFNGPWPGGWWNRADARDRLYLRYELTGCFNWKRGARLALRRKAKYYVFCLIVFSGFVIGLAATHQLEISALVGWLCAACNAWSAAFLMICLAYALVELPRHLWRLAPPDAYLANLQRLRWRRRREMLAALNHWTEVRHVLSLTVRWLEEHHRQPLRGRTDSRGLTPSEPAPRAEEVALAADEAEELEMLLGATPRRPAPVPGEWFAAGSMPSSPGPPGLASAPAVCTTPERPVQSQLVDTPPRERHAPGSSAADSHSEAEPEVDGDKGSDESEEGQRSSRWDEIVTSPPPLPRAARSRLHLWSVRGRSGSISGEVGVARENLLRDRLLNCARLVEWELDSLGAPIIPDRARPRPHAYACLSKSPGMCSLDTAPLERDLEIGDGSTGSAQSLDATGGATGLKDGTSPAAPSHEPTSGAPSPLEPEPEVFFSPWCCALPSYQPSDPFVPVVHAEPPSAGVGDGASAQPPVVVAPGALAGGARIDEATQTPVVLETEPTLASLEELRVGAHGARLAARSAVAEYERIDALASWWGWAVLLAREAVDVCGYETTVRGLCTAIYVKSFVFALQPLLRAAAALSLVLGTMLAWSEICLLLQWLVRIGAFPWWTRNGERAEDEEGGDPLRALLLGRALLSAAESGESPLLLLIPVLWMRFCIGWSLARMQHGVLALRRERNCNDSSTLLLDATNNIRLTLALCFNFGCLLQVRMPLRPQPSSTDPVPCSYTPSTWFCSLVVYPCRARTTSIGKASGPVTHLHHPHSIAFMSQRRSCPCSAAARTTTIRRFARCCCCSSACSSVATSMSECSPSSALTHMSGPRQVSLHTWGSRAHSQPPEVSWPSLGTSFRRAPKLRKIFGGLYCTANATRRQANPQFQTTETDSRRGEWRVMMLRVTTSY